MALPPFDPGVKLMVACLSPAIAVKDVGAEGVVVSAALKTTEEFVIV